MADYQSKILGIALSERMEVNIRSSKFNPFSKVTEIPNCAPTKYCWLNREEARTHLNIEQNKVILMSVVESIDYPWINAQAFIKMAALFPNVDFWVVGRIQNMSEIQPNLKYWGFINDAHKMGRLFTSANAVVIPSYEDNLPTVMLESFIHGTPVLANKIGGMAQYVVDNKTGFVSTDISDSGLQSLISRFLDSQHVFDSKYIIDFANSTFSPSKIAQQHIDIYKTRLQAF